MNDQTKQAMTMALEALDYIDANGHIYATAVLEAITALREALAQPQDMKECRHCGWLCKPNDAPSKKGYVLTQPQESKCNPHPKAPHGFVRGASHSAGEYVCECQGWEPYQAGYDKGFATGVAVQFEEGQAQPQGEWVDLTWDDYLELAGQERFYVKDPHTGIMDFCSHEFTKAAIELFKEKNS